MLRYHTSQIKSFLPLTSFLFLYKKKTTPDRNAFNGGWVGLNQSLPRNKCKSYNLIYIYLWADFDFYPSSNASLLFSLNCLYLHIFKSFIVGIKLLPPSRGLTCPKNIFLKGNFVDWGTVHKIVFALNVLTYFSSKRFSQSSLAVFQSFSLKFPRLKYHFNNHKIIVKFLILSILKTLLRFKT